MPRIGTDASRGASPAPHSGETAAQGDPGAGLRVPSRQRRAKVPTAFVSLFMPSGRRTWHWYWYTCRTCGAYQLGRARQLEDVTGTRRASCGHQVNIAVSRIYGRRP